MEKRSGDLDRENIPALRTLLAPCLGLVIVEASSPPVRLVRPTPQEHLSRDPSLFHSPHSTTGFLNIYTSIFGCDRDRSPTLHSAPTTMPLLEYPSIYLGRHTSRGMMENTKILVLRLLDRFSELIYIYLTTAIIL